MRNIANTNKLLLLGCFIILASCTSRSSQHTPTVFEPKNISTEAVEYSSTFSSSGSELYFVRSEGKWGSGVTDLQEISTSFGFGGEVRGIHE